MNTNHAEPRQTPYTQQDKVHAWFAGSMFVRTLHTHTRANSYPPKSQSENFPSVGFKIKINKIKNA